MGFAMDLGLRGKVAIVTGASRGIGAAIAGHLAAAGMKVVLAARDGGALAAIARQAPDMLPVPADLTRPEAVQQVVDGAVAAFGGIDLVVNNAGATLRGDFLKLTDADWEAGFALKFFGYVRLARAAWPHLQTRQGTLVNIIGVGGRIASAEFTIGGSVNAGLINFTKALADRGVRDGVRVVGINPGNIATDRWRTRVEREAATRTVTPEVAERAMLAATGLSRAGRPEEIAQVVAMLASAQASYVQGAIIDVDGGLVRAV
jgi:3-oxoacyl-[acyl-carrier protein] reductase